MSGVVIALAKAISAHGKTLTEIELREPTTNDLMEIGYPYLLIAGDGDETKIQLQPKIVGKYIVRLAQIPPSSVEQISLDDFPKFQVAIMGFFGRSEDSETPTNSTEIVST